MRRPLDLYLGNNVVAVGDERLQFPTGCYEQELVSCIYEPPDMFLSEAPLRVAESQKRVG